MKSGWAPRMSPWSVAAPRQSDARPSILKHFDTEAVYSLVAPRPMLMLSGDQDGGLPLDGIEILERKVGQMYRLHSQLDLVQSLVELSWPSSV